MITRTAKLNLLVAATTILSLTPAFAQKQAPPEGGPAKAFSVPANETYTLPNGLKVTDRKSTRLNSSHRL